jgi:hypothetical protein
MLPFQGEEMKGQCPFRKGKGAREVGIVSHTEEQSEDAAVRWCAAATGSWSWATSGLTRGGRHPFGSV